ncbi:hypothetical protein OKA04_00015 [Luteolibacter flavescens]|uniref:HEAT repeat domain-containing protein n=1 Tax=Luteolibacter flavescens TaxID=1859460 RepID=A0ABT3FHP3_9BACT|nr:hypothetical protein [Luteolibacter flavescens]MCW1883091.1 hypothetical protein [Luteolibacter flavescens]
MKTGKLNEILRKRPALQLPDVLDPSVPANFSPLLKAVETGFHSMVEELLRLGGWSQATLDRALADSMEMKRWDLAELIENHGASLTEMDFEEICETVRPELIERALRSGMDPAKENAFAHALNRIRARPLLGLIRSLGEEFPALRRQASLALIEAINEKKPRWVALLVWAGADPFLRVPYNLDDTWDDEDDEDYGWMPAERGAMSGDLEVFKALQLRPNSEQANVLLSRAAFCESVEILKEILRFLPGPLINQGYPPTCLGLERLLESFPCPSFYSYRLKEREEAAISCMNLLLDRGAKWCPALDQIPNIRRNLLRLESQSISKALRPIVHTPGAGSPAALKELVRTPAIRSKILERDKFLLDDIAAL